MKIQFERKDFLRQLKLAVNVAAVRDVVPILQNVKITADKDGYTYVIMPVQSE